MAVYIFVIVLIIFCIVKFDFCNRKSVDSNFFYWLICVILIFVAGLRYRVGGDTLSYFDNYYNWPTIYELFKINIFELPYQPLWYIIAAVCKLLTPEFYLFQFVQAAIVTITSFWFIKKHVRLKFIAILFWYYGVYFYFTMEVMREAICVSIWLISVDFLIHKKYFKYYLLATVAFLVHLSAFVLFFMPFVYNLMKKDFKYLLVVYISFVFSILFIISNADIFMNYLPKMMLVKLSGYSSLGVYLPTFVKSCLHALAIYLAIKVYVSICNDHPFIPFLRFEIVVFLSTGLIYMIDRVSNYFLLFEIVVITESIFILGNKISNVKCSAKLFISLSLLFVLKTYYYGIDQSHYSPGTRFYNLIIPYESIFNPRSHLWRENIYYNNVYNMQLRNEQRK